MWGNVRLIDKLKVENEREEIRHFWHGLVGRRMAIWNYDSIVMYRNLFENKI